MSYSINPKGYRSRLFFHLSIAAAMMLFSPGIRAEEFSDSSRFFGVNLSSTTVHKTEATNKAVATSTAISEAGINRRVNIEESGHQGQINKNIKKTSDETNSVHLTQLESREEVPETQEIKELEEIVVIERKPVTAASSKEVRERDFELLPILTEPADLLRVVPGLITINHAGGGKADQYFLRGFDIDHGTDLALFIDQIPINMRSHAHGQGYADLHFIIPETIETIEVYKGVYFTEFGDFANAGAVRFVTKDFVPESFVQSSAGLYAVDRFRPIARGLTLFSPVVNDDIKTLGAIDIIYDEGPFINSNDYIRVNGFGKLTWNLTDNSQLEIWGSGYYGDWNASGEIPLRAVESGLIDRFDSIDPTEGGDSQRYNVQAQYSLTPDEKSQFISSLYFTRYKLNLFTNFTFFLVDPINGDGIVQRDNRYLYGTDTRYNRFFKLFGRDHLATVGIQVRADDNDLVLANQTRRDQTDIINDVDIYEVSFSPWIETELNITDWARTILGVRWDIFHFDVNDNLDPETLTGKETDSIVSYKANLILSPIRNTEFYFNFGTGFHSNDARVVVSDPLVDTLPRSIGFEIGSRTRLVDNRLDLAAAFWFLDLDSELVFVGDEGGFEPRGKTRRYGGEFEARLALFEDWLFLHGDLNLTHARFIESVDVDGDGIGDGDRVPLAPTVLSRSGLAFRTPFRLEGAVDIIYLADRPSEETGDGPDAEGFTRVDLTLRYRYKNLEAFAIVENLFDANYREAQFFFPSRLNNEPAPVDDIHFIPGNPFSFRLGLTYYLTGLLEGVNL